MEPFNGTMYTIDVQELPSLHPTRHKVVQKVGGGWRSF